MMYCNLCSNFVETVQTPVELRAHIKQIHTQARLDAFKIPASKLKEIEATKSNETPLSERKIVVQEGQAPKVIDVPLPPTPITLDYKYSGQCPDCRCEVKTLQVKLGNDLIIVCYCLSCDKKITEQIVFPIDVQIQLIQKAQSVGDSNSGASDVKKRS